jgi:hypothetical protein
MAIGAWVMGRRARRRGAGGSARAGEVLGIVGTLLSLLPVLFVAGLLGLLL